MSAVNFPNSAVNNFPIIKPKLDSLLSMDLSQAEVVTMVTNTPRILHRSLNDHLMPVFNQLNSVIGSYQDSAAVLKLVPCVLTDHSLRYSLLNFEFLLALGVSRSRILKLLTGYGHLLGKPHSKFRDVVLKLKELHGF